MVVLLAVVLMGGLVWLVRRTRSGMRTGRAGADGAGPGFLAGRSAESGFLPR